jgi:nicotinate-nucleotide adenylyltransferase
MDISGGSGCVGIMGGSFDPIHLGHLVTAEQARAELHLDEVVFVPAGGQPQKSHVTPAELRYLMTVLATAGNPAFSVSRLEIDRPGPTYTVETLRSIRQRRPHDRLFFITGADAILNILTWGCATGSGSWMCLRWPSRRRTCGNASAPRGRYVTSFPTR